MFIVTVRLDSLWFSITIWKKVCNYILSVADRFHHTLVCIDVMGRAGEEGGR